MKNMSNTYKVIDIPQKLKKYLFKVFKSVLRERGLKKDKLL